MELVLRNLLKMLMALCFGLFLFETTLAQNETLDFRIESIAEDQPLNIDRFSAHKTTSEDTIRDGYERINFQTCQARRGSLRRITYFANERKDSMLTVGYWNGTNGPILFTSGAKRYVAEHAVRFSTPTKISQSNFRMVGAFVVFSEQTKPVDNADVFNLSVYPANLSNNPRPLISQSFSFDNFYGMEPWPPTNSNILRAFYEGNWIAFDEEKSKEVTLGRGQFFIGVETKTATSNDTLTLIFSFPNKICDPNPEVQDWMLRLRNLDNHSHAYWTEFNQFYFTGNPDRFDENNNTWLYWDQPLIIPVVGSTVGRFNPFESLGRQGDLELLQAYPNPTKGAINIPFNLEKPSFVEVKVIDNTGKIVHKIPTELKGSGLHNLNVNIENLNCGIYHYIVITSNGSMGGRISIED